MTAALATRTSPGTSFSAPEVAGVAALIWAKRPELKNYQVADIIKQSATAMAWAGRPTMGCGVLDAGAALELATSYSGASERRRLLLSPRPNPARERTGSEADCLRTAGDG